MKKIVKKVFNPVKELMEDSRTVGVLLILCTVLSILLANSNFGMAYRSFWHLDVHLLHSLSLPATGSEIINCFLMSFFFLLAGMEIKRELLKGELSSVKKAVLPLGAALGGMIVPALLFVMFTFGTEYSSGWGIPTATDIAFSLGIASLLGKRVPVGLKIFLMALAIIDDLGAIIIVAVFYGGQVNWLFMAAAVILFLMLLTVNRYKVNYLPVQIIISAFLWYAIFRAGIEASIAGVLIAFALPLKVLPKVEHIIHKPVNFLILPWFALANTAILLPSDIAGSLTTSVSMGIMAGLVLGKPIGIWLFSRVLVALNLASLPKGIRWIQVTGIGTLAGIGFTMSIFTTNLAFSSPAFQDIAKISILLSMILSLVISGLFFFLLAPSKEVISAKENLSSSSELELELN